MTTDGKDSAHDQGPPIQFTIIVNGEKKVVTQKELSFDDLVRLAFGSLPPDDNVIFTITFRRGHGERPEGVLRPGQSVKVKEGMIFDVTATRRS